jgi:predicted TIM-barrel fold metal-dependent hydrolase
VAAAPLQGPLVDSHAHIWEPDMPYAASAWTRPSYAYTAEQLLADLESASIRYGVIAAASLFGTHNDYTIRSLRKYRNLRGTVILDPTVDLYTLEAMRADGIVGARLQWYMVDPLPDIAGESFQRFCRRLRDPGMHLHLNIEGFRMPAVARELIRTGVRLVIDHYGWHDPAQRLQAHSYQDMVRLVEAGNVWVKLASGFRRPDRDLPAEYTQDLLARFGAEQLLWGSASPFVGHEHAASCRGVVEDLHYAVPDEATRRALGDSAYRFYFS